MYSILDTKKLTKSSCSGSYSLVFFVHNIKIYHFIKGRGGEVGDNLKEKTLFSLIFYGDTAYTNLFKLFLNHKASSEEYLVKFS